MILYNFGCFYTIQLQSDSLSVRELLSHALPSEKEKLDSYVQLLEDFAPMLEDYFSITFIKNDENELILKALPLVITSYEPYYGYLPLFLAHLVQFVDFTDEKKCLQGVAKEIAQFYAFIPESKDIEEWKNRVQTILYPQLKRQLIVNDRLWGNKVIQMVASTDRLYRVFERC